MPSLKIDYPSFYLYHKPMAIRVVGLDIIGPMLEAAGKVKFTIVAIDYFTK